MNTDAWNAALWALVAVSITAAGLAFLGSPSRQRKEEGVLGGFLLAGTRLGRSSVISLLLSGSFGLNGLFYQIWLGYTVGAWGLVTQGAWALSFVLLSTRTSKIVQHTSIHDLLGSSFGVVTKVAAGIFSIIGMGYMLGWEVGIGQSMFSGLLTSQDGVGNGAEVGSAWLAGAVVVAALLYTILGGIRGNAIADILLNGLKIVLVFGAAMYLVFFYGDNVVEGLLPSLDKMVENLGYWGLATNIAFSLMWQFVDMTTWQSTIAGKDNPVEDTAWNLKWSGLAVFMAPGVLGTLIGAALVGTEGINAENILSTAIQIVSGSSDILLFLAFASLIACMLSLIDGLLLANAFAIVIDVLHPRKSIDELDQNPKVAERTVLAVRVSLVLIAGIAAWGVQALLGLLGGSLFDFVYVMVITQLALSGPVIVALLTSRTQSLPMWIPILVSAIVGFGCIILGTQESEKWLIDGAGTFTIIVSCLMGFGFSRSAPAPVAEA